jgi:ribosomal protein L44E
MALTLSWIHTIYQCSKWSRDDTAENLKPVTRRYFGRINQVYGNTLKPHIFKKHVSVGRIKPSLEID